MPKGPGRPIEIKPGPTITPGDNLFISDDTAIKMLEDIMSPDAFDRFITSPKESKQIFIDQVKTTLFKVTNFTFADPKLVLLGEYGDLRGVQTTFNFQDFAKDPAGYLASLPKSYVSGIINSADIEREVELDVIRRVASGSAALKKAFPLTSNGNGLDLSLVDSEDPTKGRDDIDNYQKYSGAITDWVNNAQLLALRRPALEKLVDTSHYLVAEELAYGDRDGNRWFKEGTSSVEPTDPEFVNLLNDRLQGASEEVQKMFKGYAQSEAFNESINKNARKGASNSNIRSLLFSNQDLNSKTYYEAGKMLDSFFGNKLGDSDNFLMSEYKRKAIANPRTWGFKDASSAREVFKAYAGLKPLEIFAPKDNVSTKLRYRDNGSKLFSKREAYAFTQTIVNLRNAANVARAEIRESVEAEFRYNARQIASQIANLTGADEATRREIESRLRANSNWKEYAQVRSLMEEQEDFIKALNKGDVWKSFFYLGRYNNYMPEIIQDTHNKILRLAIPGTGLRLVDVQNRAVQFRNKWLQKAGFAGGATAKRGLFGAPNVTYSLQSTFDHRLTKGDKYEFKISGDVFGLTSDLETKFHLFENGLTFDNLSGQLTDFKEGFFNLKAPIITAFARDFAAAPDVIEGMKKMAIFFNTNNGDLPDMDTLRGLFNQARTTSDLRGFLMSVGITDETDLNKYTAAFSSIFATLEKYHAKGVHPSEFLDYVFFIESKFIKDGQLMSYMPALQAIADNLSNVQTYLYRLVLDKIVYRLEQGRLAILSPVTKWLWENVYNPRFGALNRAQKFVSWLENTGIGRLWARLSASGFGRFIGGVFKRIAPTAFTNVGSFTAFVAIFIARATGAALKSVWLALRGRFNEAQAVISKAWDEIVVKPLTSFLRLILYALVSVISLVFFIVTFFVGGILEQTSARDVTEGLQFTDYNQEIPLLDVGSQWCTDGGQYGANGSALIGNLEHPVSPNISYAAGQCPAFSPGSARSNFHAGLDYSTVVGTDIKVPLERGCGKITIASRGWNAGYGTMVKMEAEVGGETFHMIFGHLSSAEEAQRLVAENNGVACAGDVIGKTGNTGNSTGPHLHFEIRDSSGSYLAAVNPCAVLSCPSECYTGTFDEACVEKSEYEN
jgi:hypothetical protein